MRTAQLPRPLVAAAMARTTSRLPTTTTAAGRLHDALAQLRIGSALTVEGRRYASVKAQGAYRLRNSDTIPKHMGAKKTGDSYVIPGNIIYKQRGTKWFPGENVGMGRDHTLFSMATGYVKYYKDPQKHPKRQYIGVVFNKSDKLPYHPHAMRKRKLGMTASPIAPPKAEPAISSSGIPTVVVRTGLGRKPHPRDERIIKLRNDGSYAYAEESWRLGTLVKTKKRKMGSRRRVMRQRRQRRKAIGLEMRELREDRLARRKEGMDMRRKNRMRKLNDVRKRQAAEKADTDKTHAQASSPKGAQMPPPPPPKPTAD